MTLSGANAALMARGIQTVSERFQLGLLQFYFLDPDRHVIEINAFYGDEARHNGKIK